MTTEPKTKKSPDSPMASKMYGSRDPWDKADMVSIVIIMPANVERELEGRSDPSNRPATLTKPAVDAN